MKFKGAPNATSITPLERLASWSYTKVEEIISLGNSRYPLGISDTYLNSCSFFKGADRD